MSPHENPSGAGPVDPAANLASIKAEIETALKEAGRAPGSVAVTAVSKFHDADRILPVLEAGHRVFGENRVQEALAKWPALKEKYPDIELRLIGPLQTNKAKEAVAAFDVIESVDRPKLARILAGEMEKQDRRPTLYIQVNTGEEPQKAGIAPAEVGGFLTQCREEFGLEIEGLMCIPPAEDDPAPHFALLAKLAKSLGLPGLSMGMSGDYLIAAQLGATHVRIGTAIFGSRPAKEGITAA
ncbi:YggS family pyridoxal phosphate-dependent enzyme [Hyphococcus luteus]|uniref:Pyridoxal phosphate homeostasis protein n=1 Tax=Hyphococcus luteus TaxID=2058213 RepID=A0A2S7K6S5_9PROT|nr:YggS family pyridoxal phosphate-dependent enzyme [Marinicaulis flavus]PQA88176.1 YggS family pyridoxal phosphate-dependent enzyme [Marinicaulis flavus]